MSAEKEYLIDEQVPESARHYRFWDMVSTWMGGNCHPASWFVGGSIAAVGLARVIGITFIANPLAYAVMAAIGFMGYKVGTNSPGLTRGSFGIRGSAIPTLVNALSVLGWGACGIYLAAISISYILNSAIGTPYYGEPGSNVVMLLCCLFIGVLSWACVAISGTRSIKIIENVLVVALVILTIWITVEVFKEFSWAEIKAWRAPEELSMPFGIAFDVAAAYSFGWMLCLAEFTRFTKRPASAVVAPMIGANVAMFWFTIVGAIGVIGVAMTTGVFDPNYSDPSSIVQGLGLGVAALLVIIMAVITTNLINLYCGTVAINSVFKKFKFKPLLLCFSAACILVSIIPIFAASFMDAFYWFMDYLGAIFPPICAILIVDFYLIRKKEYVITELDKKGGKYWFKNGFNWYAIVACLIGFALFFVLRSCGFGANTVGVVFPNFFISAIVYYILAKIGKKSYA